MTRGIVGSSPRERGTHCAGPNGSREARIIPARAGNTTRSGSSLGTTADHPRASGEHFCLAMPRFSANGSSPRERGTLEQVSQASNGRRIIPARAGNTQDSFFFLCRMSDHPRASGEHHRRHNAMGSAKRIIPARAGNTRRAAAGAPMRKANQRDPHGATVEVLVAEVAEGFQDQMRRRLLWPLSQTMTSGTSWHKRDH